MKVKQKCGCVVEKGGWFFDVEPDNRKEPKWVKNDKLGKALQDAVRRGLKKEKLCKDVFTTFIFGSRNEKFNSWVKESASKILKKPVTGWQIRMSIRNTTKCTGKHGKKGGVR